MQKNIWDCQITKSKDLIVRRRSDYNIEYKLSKSDEEWRNYVCYASPLGKMRDLDSTKLYFRIERDSNQYSTNVVLSDAQVKEYFYLIQRHYGGIYKLKFDVDYIYFDFDESKIKVNDKIKPRFSLFVLTHMRYLFEAPYSDILYDAFKLRDKHNGKYKLYQLLIWCHAIYIRGYGHSLIYFYDNNRDEEFLKHILRSNISKLKKCTESGVQKKFYSLSKISNKKKQQEMIELLKELV